MKIKIQTILIFILLIFLFLLYYFNTEIKIIVDNKILFTFFLNIFICIMAITLDERKYSINKFFWIFNYFFLGIAPMMQYLKNVELWHVHITNDEYLITNLLILFWYISYTLTSILLQKNKGTKNLKKNHLISKKDSTISNEKIANNINKNYLILTTISFLIFILYLILAKGFSNLITIKTNYISTGVDDFDVVINISLKSIVVLSTTYMIYDYMNNKNKNKIWFILFEFIILFSLFSLNNGRWILGLVYIGLITILFGKKIKTRFFDFVIIMAIGVLFPLLQVFHFYTLSDIFANKVAFNNIFSMMSNNVDFDAYSVIPRTLDYIKVYDVPIGLQLLTSLFYFIPRSIWSWKSYPSGVLIGMTNPSNSWTNLACPLIGEGIFNFGILGVPIFAVIFCCIANYFDDKFWINNNPTDKSQIINYTYPYLLGLMFVINRGSLQFFINYTISFYLPLLLFCMFKKCVRRYK